jgi:hypothetical protein
VASKVVELVVSFLVFVVLDSRTALTVECHGSRFIVAGRKKLLVDGNINSEGSAG